MPITAPLICHMRTSAEGREEPSEPGIKRQIFTTSTVDPHDDAHRDRAGSLRHRVPAECYGSRDQAAALAPVAAGAGSGAQGERLGNPDPSSIPYLRALYWQTLKKAEEG